MIYLPNCKINVGLDVTDKRSDGFHDIQTILYPISGLRDILEVVPTGNARQGVEFSSSGLAMECAEQDNLVVQAYRLLAERYPAVAEVRVHLHKVIPLGAGLGGGSSDCAFFIRALDEIFSLGMNEEQMEQLCAELGSDIAFFVRNTPQLATGRGEILHPIELSLREVWIVIIKPNIAISTAQAYSGITPSTHPMGLVQRLEQLTVEQWRGQITNQFEEHLFAPHPLLGRIKAQLYSLGATYASMTGAGSALYGLFEQEEQLLDAVDGLREEFGEVFIYSQRL